MKGKVPGSSCHFFSHKVSFVDTPRRLSYPRLKGSLLFWTKQFLFYFIPILLNSISDLSNHSANVRSRLVGKSGRSRCSLIQRHYYRKIIRSFCQFLGFVHVCCLNCKSLWQFAFQRSRSSRTSRGLPNLRSEERRVG